MVRNVVCALRGLKLKAHCKISELKNALLLLTLKTPIKPLYNRVQWLMCRPSATGAIVQFPPDSFLRYPARLSQKDLSYSCFPQRSLARANFEPAVLRLRPTSAAIAPAAWQQRFYTYGFETNHVKAICNNLFQSFGEQKNCRNLIIHAKIVPNRAIRQQK